MLIVAFACFFALVLAWIFAATRSDAAESAPSSGTVFAAAQGTGD